MSLVEPFELGKYRPILVVIDGSKALRHAVLDVFDRPVISWFNSTRSATFTADYERALRATA